jgi:hypothetical protein
MRARARYFEPVPGLPEVPLVGGDVTDGVVRVGDTVRRTTNEQSAAVHAYLAHLERAGFDASPRFLGIDRRGREVLSYIDGEMAGRPLHRWAVAESVLTKIARLQRRLHDCSADFVLPLGMQWRKPEPIEGVPPPYDPDVVGHNDITPENVICLNREPVGIVDFDLAGPTTRLLDVVTTLVWWAPLQDPADRDPMLRDADAGRRMRLFVDAYGFDRSDRERLLDVAQRRFTVVWHVMRRRAARDGGGWARMWAEGVGDRIRRGEKWLIGERANLQQALLI